MDENNKNILTVVKESGKHSFRVLVGLFAVVAVIGLYFFSQVKTTTPTENSAASISNQTFSDTQQLARQETTTDPNIGSPTNSPILYCTGGWHPDLTVANVTISPQPLTEWDIANLPYPYINFWVHNWDKCDAIIPASLMLSLYNGPKAPQNLVARIVYDRRTRVNHNQTKNFPGQIKWVQNLTAGTYDLTAVVDDANVLLETDEANNDDYTFTLVVTP